MIDCTLDRTFLSVLRALAKALFKYLHKLWKQIA